MPPVQSEAAAEVLRETGQAISGTTEKKVLKVTIREHIVRAVAVHMAMLLPVAVKKHQIRNKTILCKKA